MKRIQSKISEIKVFLDELETIIPEKFEKYRDDKIIKAACERYVEKIVEGVTDLAFMLIKEKKYNIPEDDIDSFKVLKNNGIINEILFSKLKQAKGMRNIIAHQYGQIDDSIIFNSIKEELGKDIASFLTQLKTTVFHPSI